MKLTKGKISKLYNKHKQSCRRKKICKRRKNNQSFRKSKPLNLATKTLKMKGGVASVIGRTASVATDVTTTGVKKVGKILAESTPVKVLGTGAKFAAGLVYNLLAEPYRLLRDMKTVGSDWYFQTKKFTYDTKATIDKNIEDLKNSITSTVYSDIKFFEFDTPKTYKYVMISMYEYVIEYWKLYPKEFDKNTKAQTALFADPKSAFFKDLYETYRTYEEYCKFIDGYVNNPDLSKVLKELNGLYIKYSPGLNHGVRIICGSNLYQLETAVKKKQKLDDEIKNFKRYNTKTDDLIDAAIKSGLNDKFFKEILEFFKTDPDDFHKINNYRSYYSIITDNENKYRDLDKQLKKKKGSIDDEVFNVLKSALDKMKKKIQISLFGSTNDGKSFYKRQEKFNVDQAAFNKTADQSVIRRNEKAIEELRQVFLSRDQKGGVNDDGASSAVDPPAVASPDGASSAVAPPDGAPLAVTPPDGASSAVDPPDGAPSADANFDGISKRGIAKQELANAKQQKVRLDDARKKGNANQEFEEQNKQVEGLITQYKAYDIPAPNESSEITPPEINKKFLEDIDSCVLFEDYIYVIREYARKISKEELDTWYRRLEEYNPNTKVKTDNRNKLNDSYYKEYKSILNDLKEKLALRQFPSTFSRFLSKIKSNSEETKFITTVFNVAQKKTELENKNDPRLNQASDESKDKLKRSSDIFKDFLGIYDDASKIYNGEPVVAVEQKGGAGLDDDLDNLYTKYNKYIDYFAKTFNRETIQKNKSELESYKDTLNSVYYDALTSDLNKIEQKIIERGTPVGVSDKKLISMDQLRKIPFFDKIYTKKNNGEVDDAIVKSVVDEYIYRTKAKGLSDDDKNSEIQSYEKQLNQQLTDGKIEYDDPFFQLFTKAIKEFQKRTNSSNLSKVAVPRLDVPIGVGKMETPTLKRKADEVDEESDEDSMFGTPRGPSRFGPSRSGNIEQRIEYLENFMQSLNQENSSNTGNDTLSILKIFRDVVNPVSSRLGGEEQERERGAVGRQQPLKQQVEQQAMMKQQTSEIRNKDQQIEQQQQQIKTQKEEINKQRTQLIKLSSDKTPSGQKELTAAKGKLKDAETSLEASIKALDALTSENAGLKTKVQEMEKNKGLNDSISKFKNSALLFDGAKKQFELSLESEQKVAEAKKNAQDAEKAADDARQKAAAKTAEHAAIVSDMKTKLEQTTTVNQEKIAELQDTVAQAQAQAEAAETAKNALVVSIQEKDAEIASLKGSPESAATKQALEDQLKTMQAQLEAATEKAKVQEEALAKQQSDLEQQKGQLEQSLQNRSAEIEQATAAVTAEKDAAIAKAADADRLKEEAAVALETANIEKEAEINRLKLEQQQAIVEAQREKEAEIERLKDDHETQMATKDNALEAKSSELVAALNEIKSTKDALAQNVVQQQELDRQQTELKVQLEQEQAKLAAQQADIKSSSDLSAAEQAGRMEEANKSVEELKAKLAENAEKLASITKANEELNAKQNELGAEMDSLKLEKASLENDKVELEKSKQEQSSLIETLRNNQRFQPVVVDEKGQDAPTILNGILKSIRGGSVKEVQSLEQENTDSVFLTSINDKLDIELKNCMYPSPLDKNIEQLRTDMVTFSKLINKVIYNTPIIVMLNSLSFQEYDELMNYVKSQSADQDVVLQNSNIIAYLKSFMEFVMFDTTQLYQFSNKDGTPPYIISDLVNPEFKQILPVTYDSIHVLCKDIDFVDKPDADVLRIRNQGFKEYLVLPEDVSGEDSIYKQRLVVTHILETVAFFDNLVKKDVDSFKTLTMKPGVYSFINSLMYGRVMKLNELITCSKPFETCSVMCEASSKDCPADEACQALNNSFIAKLSSIIEDRSPVSTHLILNNKGGSDYNRSRFELKTDRQKQYLQVKYNGDDKSYDPSSLRMTDDAKSKATNFLFGKFDKIFTINTSVLDRNQTISQDLIKIQEQLLTGDPVFVIGYGQSGAGKTSSLIYLKYKDENNKEISKNGVLIHLCNLLGKGSIEGKGPYTKLTLTTQEFYNTTSNANPKTCDGTQNTGGCVKQTFKFAFLSDNFVLQPKQDKKTIKFPYRDTKLSFNAGTQFGEVLKDLIDTDRFVKPTPNNPDSSRSHSLIYIKLEKDAGDGPDFLHLFIGDFAGVENKFDCENEAVLDKFLHLNIDRPNEKSAYVYAAPADRNPKSIDPKFDLTLDNVNKLFSNTANFQMTEKGTLEAKGDNAFETSVQNFINNPSIVNLPPVPTKDTLNYDRNKLIFDTLKKPMITQDLGLLSGRSGVLGRGGKRIKSKSKRRIKNKTRKIVMKGGAGQISSLDESLSSFKVINSGNQDSAQAQIDKWIKKQTIKADSGKSFKNSAIVWVMMNIIDENSFDFYSMNLVGFFNKDLVTNNTPIFNEYSRHLEKKVYKKVFGELGVELNSLTDLLNCRDLDNIILGITVDTSGEKQGSDYTSIDYVKDAIQTNYKKLIMKQILKVIKYSPNDYDKAKTIIKYGKDICNERVSEGVFINDTLAQLRTTIFDIMMKKTKDIIYYSPQFYYQCLPDLCPSARDCFLIRPKKPMGGENTEPNSLIIKWIMNEYNLGLGISDQAPVSPVKKQAPSSSLPQQSVALKGKSSKPPALAPAPAPKAVSKNLTYDEFCSKLHISLFCVFDISTKANNPPPIPYVNINELKKQWNVMQSAHYDTPKDFETANSVLIERIRENEQLNKEDIDVMIKYLDNPKSLQYNEGSISATYTKIVNDFIEKIERTNAATSIGTLEYLNSFAALNTINTSCIGKVSTDTTEDVITK